MGDLNQVLITEDLPEVPEMHDVTSLPVNALDPPRVRPLTTATFRGMQNIILPPKKS